MADLPVDDEDGGELDEAEVVLSAVLPSHEQAAEAIEPAVADLDHPPARRMPFGIAGRGQRRGHARLGRKHGLCG